jgi:hypothetical protein
VGKPLLGLGTAIEKGQACFQEWLFELSRVPGFDHKFLNNFIDVRRAHCDIVQDLRCDLVARSRSFLEFVASGLSGKYQRCECPHIYPIHKRVSYSHPIYK